MFTMVSVRCARTAARALRIRERRRQLHFIDARQEPDHPVMLEINSRGLDIDKGTVIEFGGNFYHGGDTMVVMALLGSRLGWFLLFGRTRSCSVLNPSRDFVTPPFAPYVTYCYGARA